MYNFVLLTNMKNTRRKHNNPSFEEMVIRFWDTLMEILKFRKKQLQPIPVKK